MHSAAPSTAARPSSAVDMSASTTYTIAPKKTTTATVTLFSAHASTTSMPAPAVTRTTTTTTSSSSSASASKTDPPTPSPPLTRASVADAYALIAPHVNRTPLLQCRTLDELASTPRTPDGLARSPWAGRPPARPNLRFWFKCENLQRVGAFKARGAMHAVMRLVREPGFVEAGGMEKGVATHSSGNHAQGLSWAAKQNNLPAHIVMPRKSNAKKIQAARGYGANITFCGPKPEDRAITCDRVIAETGARLIPPYDNPNIILGAGSVGLELQEQFREANSPSAPSTSSSTSSSSSPLPSPPPPPPPSSSPPKPDAVLVPCGGGGLLSGVALSCEGTGIRVFGTEPSMSGANDVCKGFAQGKRVEYVSSRTVADGLRTPMGLLNWHVCYERRLVAGMYSVTDAEIMAAVRLIMERMKLVVEPSAAVPLAVALFDEDFRTLAEKEGGEKGWDVVVIFSGGNVDLDLLSSQLTLADEVRL